MKRKIRKAAVLGAGVMGSAIAAHLTNAGIPTYLLDIVPSTLTDDDKKKGFIVIENRRGEIEKFNIAALSIGVVTTKNRNFTHIGEISKLGAELKKYAKKTEESNYVVDRRVNQGER